MREVLRHRWASVLAASVALAATACGSSAPTVPSSYIVSYQLSSSTNVTLDSLKYDNGHGVLVKVAPPTPGAVANLSVASGGSIEAHVWGTATAGAQVVQLKVTWSAAGAVQSDSSRAVISAPGSITLNYAKRTI